MNILPNNCQTYHFCTNKLKYNMYSVICLQILVNTRSMLISLSDPQSCWGDSGSHRQSKRSAGNSGDSPINSSRHTNGHSTRQTIRPGPVSSWSQSLLLLIKHILVCKHLGNFLLNIFRLLTWSVCPTFKRLCIPLAAMLKGHSL